MNDFSIILTVLVIGFGLYLMYRFVKDYIKHRKAKEEFIASHKKAEKVNDSNGWIIFYSGLLAAMITLLIVQFNHLDLITKLAYIFAIVFCISLTLDVLNAREIYFIPEGFFMDTTYYRFKSIKKLTPPKGKFFSTYTLEMLDGTSVKISKKLGDEVAKKLEERKNKKKNKRK